MSLESMAIALHHSRARGTARLVLLGIANHDGDGGAWPSVATLARYANVTERNVQKAIDQLATLGEVNRLVQAGGMRETPDHRRPNRYLFLLKCPPGCDGTRNHRVRVSEPTPGVGSDGGGVSEATPEPSLNHPSTTEIKNLTFSNVRACPGQPRPNMPHEPGRYGKCLLCFTPTQQENRS